MMTLRLLFCLLAGSSLWAQTPVIDVNFDNNALQGIPNFGPFDPETPSELRGGDLNSFLVIAATGNRGFSEAAGLVTMVRVEAPDQGFSHEMIFSGEEIFPPVTAGVIEVSFDLVVEDFPIDEGFAFLRNFGAGFQSFADVVISRSGSGFGIGPLTYNSEGESFVDETTLAYFPIDVWFRITTVIDVTQGTINVLVDGEDYGLTTNYGSLPVSGYTGSSLSWESGYIGLMCIDNFRVILDDVAMGTLPVTWRSLSAEWTDDCGAVDVQWETEQEASVSSYRLERTYDGVRWRPVGPASQPGSSRYILRDNSTRSSDVLYRVRQDDLDGTVYYSAVFGPGNTDCATLPEVTIFPNPASKKLWVRSDEQTDYRVVDATGRIVVAGRLANDRVEIDVTRWSPGAYWLQAGDGVRCFLVR